MRRLLLLAAFLLIATPAAASPSSDLARVIADHWKWYLSVNPVYATALGVRDYDMLLNDPSLAEQDREAAQAAAFSKRLAAIPDAGLSPAERTNKAILKRVLDEQVEGNTFGERQILFTSYSSWHQAIAGMADNLPFATGHDYESYLARLAQYPAYNAEAMRITRQGVAQGFVQPCVSLAGFEKSISGVIAGPVEQSRFFAPFTRVRPRDRTEAEWSAMKARATALIRDTVYPEYAKFAAYFRTDYLPKCRKVDGVSALPRGRDYYAYRVRVETTTSRTPDEIHALGLSEVARIRAEMDTVAKKAGYPGRAAFIAKLRGDPSYYPKTPEELMRAAAFQAKTIDGMLPRWFGRLPRLPYGIRAIPAETAEGTTTAYYSQGSPAAGIAGTYYVNTSKLDQRPFWELPALTAHEAVPGHHLQIALQQELALPEFRKNAVSFTAFVEGWALYTEHLGVEMGLYDTPEKDMGRLSYEMWRACRLVVDTGIHWKGWDKAKAVAFMKDNSALSDANIDAEVNRYISWPAQALAYKSGELKIRELRARAERALGARFDIRAFHDAVLGQGPVPLDVLDAQINAWIAKQQGGRKPRA